MSAHVLPAQPLLNQHRSVRTSVPEEAERSVSRSLNGHRLVDVAGELDLVHNVASIGRVSLHYIDYGAPVTILPQQLTERFFLVQVPLRGSMWLRGEAGTTIEAGAGTAVISEVGRGESTMSYSDHCSRLLIKIPLGLLRDRQQRLGIESLDRRLDSRPVMDVDSGRGRSWLDLVRTTVTDLDSGNGMMSGAAGAQFFEGIVIDGLLLSSGEARAPESVGSRAVAHAMTFITAHLGDPITVVDIAGAAYLSVRAVQDGFRKELGMTPLEYVRNCRLDAIRHDLQSTEGGRSSVGEIASRWGMAHLGRFAAAYRGRFGETPSETLRRVAGAGYDSTRYQGTAYANGAAA